MTIKMRQIRFKILMRKALEWLALFCRMLWRAAHSNTAATLNRARRGGGISLTPRGLVLSTAREALSPRLRRGTTMQEEVTWARLLLPTEMTVTRPLAMLIRGQKLLPECPRGCGVTSRGSLKAYHSLINSSSRISG